MNARIDALHAPTPPALREVTLEDKYTATTGEIYLSGIQALVRLPLMQRLRDQAAGLHTGGFVSGYRGSPLGGLDEALWHAKPHLDAHHVRFVPGVNEELAATAVWGSQQVLLLGKSDYDGVFGLWYGKGPGVDRSIDVFKHMNHAGTSRHGGVLLVAGDDHNAYSSTLPHQSDHVFAASMIPMLYPCNVQEYIELGLHGWAMSRFSGCAVGFKALADTVESSASISADPFAVQTRLPGEFVLPEGGLNNRLSTDTLGVQARKQEALMQDHKIYAAMAYARENRLNRVTIDAPGARLGIVASGKSYLDVLEALEELGIDEALAATIGIRLFKVSMPWPLEPEGIREFARGLEEILVVEEKRQVVEYQLKEQLYNWREDVRPRVIGKFDERGEWDVHNPRGRGDWLLSATGDFSVAQVARVIAARIRRLGLETHTEDLIQSRLDFLEAKDRLLQRAVATPTRPAWYCSGCPHNTSTRVPEGSFALAGIGCHVMATAIYPEFNKLTTQMGGEGAPWIGASAFSQVPHVFANLGDGTYYHSGYLAIRAAVAANRTMPVNITYKVLYNDAVAMTGGQPVDGPIGVREIARQLSAEGVQRIAVVTEDLGRYADRTGLPGQATLHDRAELDAVQCALRDVPGVSVIVYDQTCAAEKRRRRKKKEYPQATERVFINEAVCEGCGDCGQQSNCTAILPKETPLGRKRAIDQSSCNADLSCLKGFCPSFVTVSGATPRRAKAAARELPDFSTLPLPSAPSLAQPFNILITGIGGTGVITIGALIGMAAHLERKGASVLDMTGMSQKNGAVTSHVRLAGQPAQLRAQRIATGEADLILACDMLTAGAADALAKMRPGRTLAVVNRHEQPAGPFARDPDWQFPADDLQGLIREATGERAEFHDATALATALLGDAIGANLFLLGLAFQRGALPLSLQALLRAIELNGVAVAANVQAFQWGRLAAIDPERVHRLAQPAQAITLHRPQSLAQLVKRRVGLLTAYQNAAYAARYAAVVERVREAEARTVGGDRLSKVVASNIYKLMAYKDEYEVARLYSDPAFKAQLEAAFEGPLKLQYHLAPPVLDAAGGPPRKRRFGAWMGAVFPVLARLKFLRGTVLDVFGHTAERRMERALIEEYQALIEREIADLDDARLERALALARVPETIRGYGHVKAASVVSARARWSALRAERVAGQEVAEV
ncbi:indolepyruvate ferredoxin oxidoreductase family protein [Hydrogenophaga sp. BPS33]|uniref:indolepyruvate ferredoxin oxidoreductase family protein n=1 Tax=Hydrogenophaga sp. BPS33 TaxID=2651974 RepID=UPI00132035CB|nr:indolepyruvate ferredoxin oxidoreductase family protein [Hydrogenophaga sp. BPS33]QHE83458.1 indolepyruvate ferredoxin oxidoreductase family protein [Hydrogenophaga sp. BPS33]